jgi:hypothetical protein
MADLGFIYEKGITNESGLEYIIEPHLDHSIKYYEKAKSRTTSEGDHHAS